MPSAQAKKKADRKKAQEKERMAKLLGKKAADDDLESEARGGTPVSQDPVEDLVEDLSLLNSRATAGVLSSHGLSADIHIHNFSMTFHGKVSYRSCPSTLC